MSASTDPDVLFAEALSLGADERARAREIFQQLSQLPPCDAWAGARLELANQAFGEHADDKTAIALARSVLESPREAVSEVPRAIAGVMMASAQDMIDQPFDERMLRDSAERCEKLAQQYWAATGFRLLALREVSEGDRLAARQDLEHAADLFDAAGSMLGGPSALERLARMDIEEQRFDEARAHLDRGIARLKVFPYGGFQVRNLEDKLMGLRGTLENKGSEARDRDRSGSSEQG
jgi:hypothetical protein